MENPLRELTDVLGEIETLLKNPDIGAALTAKGVNTSLALVLVDGLRAYLDANKERTIDDVETFLEEVKGRLALSRRSS
jgi:hypothetical protein